MVKRMNGRLTVRYGIWAGSTAGLVVYHLNGDDFFIEGYHPELLDKNYRTSLSQRRLFDCDCV